MADLKNAAPRRAAFIFVFITVALDMLALGVMIPVLPKLILSFKPGDVGRAAEITGVFGFAWAAMQFFFSPVLGSLSDRIGRRPVILLSNLGLGLDYVIMALAPSLGWLFLGRLVSGITAASYPTATAYIADVTPPEKRAASFGMLGAAFGLGFVVGPAVGGFLGQIDLRLPFWAAAVLSLLNTAYGFFVLPESLPLERRGKFNWKKANPVGSLKLLRSHPELFGLALACFLYFLAHESLPSVFVLYASYRYSWTDSGIGTALALTGVCSTVVSATLIGRAVRTLGEARTLMVGLFFGILGFSTYGFAFEGWEFMLGIPLIGLWGLTGPSMQALMSRRVGASEQGQLQGALGSMRGISGMIGPLLFTQVFAMAIDVRREIHLPGAPYLFAGGLIFFALLLSFRVVGRGNNSVSSV